MTKAFRICSFIVSSSPATVNDDEQPTTGYSRLAIGDNGSTTIKLYFSSAFKVTPSKSEIDVSLEPITIATANKDITNVVSSDASVEIVSYDNREIKVRGKNAGTGTATITVYGEDILDTFTITVDKMQLLPNDGNGNVTLNALADSNTAFSAITVTHTNGKNATITYPNGYGDYATFSYADGEITITPKGTQAENIVTTKSFKFGVSYGGVDRTITLNINPSQLTAEVSQDTVNVGSTFTIRTNKPVEEWSLDSSLKRVGTPVHGDDGYYTYTIMANGETDVDDAEIVLTNVDTGEKVTRTINVKMVYEEKTVDVTDMSHVTTITLKKDTTTGEYLCNDTATLQLLSNLPITDDDGNSYHYYIKENTTGLNGYVPWKYSPNNGDIPKSNGTMSLHVYNGKNEEKTPEGSSLPTSGGSGTAPYQTAGFLLMMTAVTFQCH